MTRIDEHDLIATGFSSPIRAFSTTRRGGVSLPPFESFNLGASCGDWPDAVAENRRRLGALLPGPPSWLKQVHGNRVIHLDDWQPGIEADAAWTDRPGQVACVLAADCLPVLLADSGGRCVAAIHAGWRGLAGGILASTVSALPVQANRLQAWLGPRIGPSAYEVGPEFRSHFQHHLDCLTAGPGDRLLADLAAIARAELRELGVREVRDCGLCTASDAGRFFSYRRDGRTGRMASVIFIAALAGSGSN